MIPIVHLVYGQSIDPTERITKGKEVLSSTAVNDPDIAS